MDIAHWGMGGAEVGPVGIEAAGYSPNYGKPNYPDQFGTFAARLEYPQGIELYFLSSYSEAKSSAQTAALQKELYRIYGKVPASILEDKRSGVLFMGSNGTIFVSRDQVAGDGIGELEKIPLPENENVRWRACLFAHMQNFLDCVKTRQTPVSCVPEQHRTLIPCQLTNIALRLGRKLKWDPQGEQFIGDVEANGMLRRVQREPYRVAS